MHDLRAFRNHLRLLLRQSGCGKKADEMITFFQVNGMMLYVDPWGKVQGYEDVFSKIDLCKKHFAAVGLGEDFVNQFIR